MLFAAQDIDPAFLVGAMIGGLVMGVICGLWPLNAGTAKGRTTLGMVGFGVCALSGVALGCLLALPMAILFRMIIGMLPPVGPQMHDEGVLSDEPFNPYAGGKRSAF